MRGDEVLVRGKRAEGILVELEVELELGLEL